MTFCQIKEIVGDLIRGVRSYMKRTCPYIKRSFVNNIRETNSIDDFF